MAAAIQAEQKDAALQDDRVSRKRRYVTALERRLGARFLDGLCTFKGSYSRLRRAPPRPGDLKESDRDVGSVAARVSMFANMNDHEAVDLFEPNPNPDRSRSRSRSRSPIASSSPSPSPNQAVELFRAIDGPPLFDG